jgi:hypothetical protein
LIDECPQLRLIKGVKYAQNPQRRGNLHISPEEEEGDFSIEANKMTDSDEKKEALERLEKAMGPRVIPEACTPIIAEMFHLFDLDKSGTIDFVEFLKSKDSIGSLSDEEESAKILEEFSRMATISGGQVSPVKTVPSETLPSPGDPPSLRTTLVGCPRDRAYFAIFS